MINLLVGDALTRLRELPDGFVQCVVTSPPYFGLRNYGVDGQIGLEATPDGFVAALVGVFREVRRVLRPDGILWLNLGDSYAGSATGGFRPGSGRADGVVDIRGQRNRNGNVCPPGVKPKDLLMIPARVAIALQADGWWLRSDIIWCLSGGTWLYARTQKGEMPVMLKDLVRLDPSTVQLWNGERWTRVVSWRHNADPQMKMETDAAIRRAHRFALARTSGRLSAEMSWRAICCLVTD